MDRVSVMKRWRQTYNVDSPLCHDFMLKVDKVAENRLEQYRLSVNVFVTFSRMKIVL